MKILILGASGYIGNHIIPFLQDRGHAIFGMDLLPSLKISKECQLIGDVRVFEELNNSFTLFDPEVVIDLAALTVVGNKYGLKDYDSNFCTPRHIINIIKGNQLSLRNVIFTSTQYVIGPDYSGRNILGFAPHTTYGQSKVLLEQNIFENLNGFKSSNVSFCIVRPTNVWGGKHPKYSTIWERLLIKGLVAIPTTNIMKSYCHITTLCETYFSLLNFNLDSEKFSDHVIYGTDELISQIEWVELQAKAFNNIGIKANYHKVPVFFLRAVSLFLTFMGDKNPLPSSRVDSMLIDYKVSLKRPEFVAPPKSIDELREISNDDVKNRYLGD